MQAIVFGAGEEDVAVNLPAVVKCRDEVGGVDVFIVKADQDKLPEVRESLLKLARENGLIVQSFSELQGEIQGPVVLAGWRLGQPEADPDRPVGLVRRPSYTVALPTIVARPCSITPGR